jgi:chaperonin GroES
MVTSTENDNVEETGDEPVVDTEPGPQSATSQAGNGTVDRDTTPRSDRKAAKRRTAAGEGLPIKMLHDRILVQMEGPDGDRRSSGGILIPATAQVGKRLTWAEIVAAGPNVRTMELGDRVLFNPEDRYEVEVGGRDYIILRERDIHAVAAERLDDSPMGLYL